MEFLFGVHILFLITLSIRHSPFSGKFWIFTFFFFVFAKYQSYKKQGWKKMCLILCLLNLRWNGTQVKPKCFFVFFSGGFPKHRGSCDAVHRGAAHPGPRHGGGRRTENAHPLLARHPERQCTASEESYQGDIFRNLWYVQEQWIQKIRMIIYLFLFIYLLSHLFVPTVLWSFGQPLSCERTQYRHLRVRSGPDRPSGDEVLI